MVASLGIDDPLVIESAAHPIIPPLQAPLITLIQSQPFSIAPSLDEPVTGAGNDSLWTGLGVGVGSDGADAGTTTGTGEQDKADRDDR